MGGSYLKLFMNSKMNQDKMQTKKVHNDERISKKTEKKNVFENEKTKDTQTIEKNQVDKKHEKQKPKPVKYKLPSQ